MSSSCAPLFSLSDEDIEESMELYGLTYDDFFASEGIVVCPDEEVFHTATVLKDSNAVFALLDWESDEPWNEHILLTRGEVPRLYAYDGGGRQFPAGKRDHLIRNGHGA